MSEEHKVANDREEWDWLALDLTWDWPTLDLTWAPAEARGGVKFRPDRSGDSCILGCIRLNDPD